MTILHIINNLDYGGAELLLLQLARAQRQAGHVVKIVCVAPVGALADHARRMQVPVETLDQTSGVSLKAIWRLIWIIRRAKTDIVHNHNPRGQVYGSLAAWFAGVKNITTRHGDEYRALPAWAWRLTDRVVFISRATQTAFVARKTVAVKSSAVIHNGIELSAFARQGSKQPGVLRVGVVARLAPVKDIGNLIRAFQIVSRQVQTAELVIVGDGAERKTLEALASGYPIHFLGSRDDIPELLSTFDVYTLSSLSEGISLSLLEAMAASKPVVATNVGGNPEVVVDGVTGFLVPPREPEAMAQKILHLLNDPALALGMGRAGRARAEAHFSLEVMAAAYEGVYNAVLGQGH